MRSARIWDGVGRSVPRDAGETKKEEWANITLSPGGKRIEAGMGERSVTGEEASAWLMGMSVLIPWTVVG